MTKAEIELIVQGAFHEQRNRVRQDEQFADLPHGGVMRSGMGAPAETFIANVVEQLIVNLATLDSLSRELGVIYDLHGLRVFDFFDVESGEYVFVWTIPAHDQRRTH